MNKEARNSFEQKGFYDGSYEVELKPYEGLDFSRRCFVFPGQNSAFAGMFKSASGSDPSLIARLREADELGVEAGIGLVSRYIFNSEQLAPAELCLLKNPALYALEVGLYEALLAKGVYPEILTSHSFGEYAAIVAAGIGSFKEIFNVVVARDRFCLALRSPGSMIAASATSERLVTALSGINYYLANTNSPKQVVIAVRRNDEKDALAALKKNRIAATALVGMPQAFHSPLMGEVRDKMKLYLAESLPALSPPRISFLSSVTGEILTASNFESLGGSSYIHSLICDQVTAPVNFEAQIQAVRDCKILNFTEVGPSETCGQFISDIFAGSVYKVSPLSRFVNNGANDAKKAPKVRRENSGVLNRLSKVIASVTGYRIEEISIEDNFQEDLGIDSIRKAEIVFKFMESMRDSSNSQVEQLNLSQIKSVEDIIEHFERIEAQPSTTTKRARHVPRFERYVESWEIQQLTDFERLNFQEAIRPVSLTIELNEELQNKLHLLSGVQKGSQLILVARATGDEDLTSPRAIFETRVRPLLSALKESENVGFKIALVHESKAHPYFIALDGFLKCWLREEGIAAYRNIELSNWPDRLAEFVAEQFLDPRFTEIRIVEGQRFVKRWKLESSEASEPLSTSPVIVSLGGAKGIGTVILSELMGSYPKAQVYVLGRTGADDSTIAERLNKFKLACEKFRYLQVDVTNTSLLTEAIESIHRSEGRIDLVLNGAGSEMSRAFKEKSDADIWAEFESKVSPATTLSSIAQTTPVGRILNYSSIAAEFGNPGQSIYAFANGVMTAMGAQLNATQISKVTSMVLPPWENLGMTENPLILNTLRARGISMLAPEQGARLVAAEALAKSCDKVAYLDSSDIRAYDCGLLDKVGYLPIFDAPISLSRSVSLPNLNLKDQPYLADHRVNNNVIYPASAALATMFYASYLYFQRIPILEKFEILNFLSPEAGASTCRLEVDAVGVDRLRLRMVSAKALHYQCEAVASMQPQLETRSPKLNWPKFNRDLQLNPEPLYYSTQIHFGNHFQLAAELWFDEAKSLMQITRETNFATFTASKKFDRLQQWFESTLQVLGGQLLWKTNHQWVPSSIERIVAHFDRGLTDELHHRVHVITEGAEECIASGQITNLRGETVLEMCGIRDIDLGPNVGKGQFFTRRAHSESWQLEAT